MAKTPCAIQLVASNWDEFKSRVKADGFKNYSSVLVYLAISVWKKENGLPVSSVVDEILGCMDGYKYRHGFYATTMTSLYVKQEDLLRISEIKLGKSRNDLFNRIVFAFITASDSSIEGFLSELIRNCASCGVNKFVYVRIPDRGYDILQEMAIAANTSVAGLFWLTVDAFFEEEWIKYTFGNLSSLLEGIMNIKGYVFRSCKPGRRCWMLITNNSRLHKVESVMKNYNIPGPSELLYRIVFFLLESRKLPAPFLEDNYVSDDKPDDNELFDENEIYWNDRFSEKAYLHELYG